MKRLIYIFLVLAISCKDSDMYQLSSPQLDAITGTWRLTAEEQGFVGQSAWQTLKPDSTTNITFRGDGVILNAKGLPACCTPTSLTVNGKFLEIKPIGILPANTECQLVNCTNCQIWDIVLTGNEMVISSCSSARRRYTRK